MLTIKIDQFYTCFFGDDYQQVCDSYVFRSMNHEMFFRKVRKNSLSDSAEKR